MPRKLKSSLLIPLLLLLVSLPGFGQSLPSQTALSLNPLSNSPNTLEPVSQLTESQLYTLFDQVAKAASDKAVQLTVAEWKPKYDAAMFDLKNSNVNGWKMAGEGFLVGAGLVAVIVVIKGLTWK